MSHYNASVLANAFQVMNVGGRFLAVDSMSGASEVLLNILRGSQTVFRGPVRRGTKVDVGSAGFDSIKFEAGASAVDVGFFASVEDIVIQTTDGVTIINDASNPVQVEWVGATLAVDVVTEKKAGTLTDAAAVAATAVRAALLAASGTRRGFRVRNAGPDQVAIGGAAVTFADAAIVIEAGETWIESEAAGAAWSCICDAGKTASLKVLELAL